MQNNSNNLIYKNTFLEKLFLGNISTKNIYYEINKHNVNLLHNFYIPIIISVDSDNQLFLKSYDIILVELISMLSPQFKGEVFYSEERQFFSIIISEINTFSKLILKKNVNNLCYKIKEYFQERHHLKPFIIIGNDYNDLNHLISVFQNLLKVSCIKYFVENQFIINIEEVNRPIKNLSTGYLIKVGKLIIENTESGNIENAKKHVIKLYDEIELNYDAKGFLYITYFLVASFTSKILEYPQAIKDFTPLYRKNFQNKKHALNHIIYLINTYCELKKINNNLHTTINKVLYFIENNYDTPITLYQLAEYTRTSRIHICRLFTQELGVSFVDYLTSYRLNKAKELLIDKKNSITKVSQLTGFSNPKYFAEVFKKNTGMSPKKYQISNMDV